MTTPAKLVSMRPERATLHGSPLTPELKQFIDRAIVPALVKLWLAEGDSSMAESGSTAAPNFEEVRP